MENYGKDYKPILRNLLGTHVNKEWIGSTQCYFRIIDSETEKIYAIACDCDFPIKIIRNIPQNVITMFIDNKELKYTWSELYP